MERERPARGPGLLVAVVVGAACWRVGRAWTFLDPLVLALLAGVVLGSVLGRRRALAEGFDAALRLFLPAGVVLYGVNLKLDAVSVVSLFAAVQIYAGAIAAFVAVVWAARRLGLREKSALLIFAGTAVCGASAIAVAAPAVKAEKEDFSLAVLSITVWALAGLALAPLLRARLGLGDAAYALLTGTTLHMTGFVATAASAAGAQCLAQAMSVKMVRTLSLLAIVPLLSWRGESLPGEGARPLRLGALGIMGGFAAVALLASFVPFVSALRPALSLCASLLFSVSLASVGLATDAASVLPSLGKGLLAALAGWLGLIAVFAAGMLYFGY